MRCGAQVNKQTPETEQMYTETLPKPHKPQEWGIWGGRVSEIDPPPAIPASREACPQVISFPFHGFS